MRFANATVSLFRIPAKTVLLSSLVLGILLAACSGEDGVNGVDGKDAAEVNLDSLTNVLRAEITGSLWDTLYAKPYVDTVYQILFDNAYGESWMDSARHRLVDSLKQADFDSLYRTLYDSVYADIYSQSVIRSLDAYVYTVKEDIYGAFANQYPLMYKSFTSDPVPLSVQVRNTCETGYSAAPCRYKKILVKAWIEGFTDTAAVTEIVNPNATKTLAPSFRFDNAALAAVTTPLPAQFQIRAYALENDHELLFYSASEPTTIHPMQTNGGEYVGVQHRDWWWAVWSTPTMDSIDNILNNLRAKLPGGTVKVYQQYDGDASVAQSSSRVAKAVFEVLQARGIAYVQNDGSGSLGQKVNYPVEVLRARNGLCIETTMLFASVFEALGFETAVIMIPGHSFVGWRVEPGSNTLNVLETTMVGDRNATFASANNAAIDTFNEQVGAGNFSSGVSSIVYIDDAREYGILPNDIP